MSSMNKKRISRLSALFLFAPFLVSCINTEIKAFSKLFEANVVWSDEEEKIKIFVHDPYVERGIAKAIISGEETLFKATFTSDNLNDAKIRLSPEKGSGGGFSLFFQKAEGEDSALFKVKGRVDVYDDPSLIEDSLVTLKKRPMVKSDLDARNFIGYGWHTEDEELYLMHRSDTPFDGKMVGKYKDDQIEFKFLEGDNYKMTNEKGLLGEGKYSTDFDGMTLFFGVYGSEEFGESLWLKGEWRWTESSDLSSN